MIEVRPPVPSDARGIAEVHVRAWQQGYAGILDPAALARLDVDRRESMWTRLLAEPDLEVPHWVATDGDTVVGFAAAGAAREDGPPGELWVLNVHPDHWRRGVGGALHAAAIEHLRARFDAAQLWVVEGNARARSFYEAHGWRADGERQHGELFGLSFEEVRYTIDLGTGDLGSPGGARGLA